MTLLLSNAVILQTQAHIQSAHAAFGPAGGDALRLLMDSIRLILAAHPPELIPAPLTIVAPTDSSLPGDLATMGAIASFQDARDLAASLAGDPNRPWLVVIAPDRSFRLVSLSANADRALLAANAVVYHREDGIERIAAGEHENVVVQLSPISASAFADPTFNSLDDALDDYGRRISDTACEILKAVWEGGGVDGPRLVLKNRPENLMRESLFHALSLVLRHVDVTREHTLDANKPVDVHVSWTNSPAEALIEIKWIGRSVTASGSKNPYLDYTASRAQKGANQLANYLDIKKSSAPKSAVLGYLVVYDARRKSIQGPEDKLAMADANHFQASEIAFDPDHNALRSDFVTPRRWFMRPRESHFLEAA